MNGTCSTCAYWAKQQSCHRYPKLVYTAAKHWCGEHKKPKKPKKPVEAELP